MTNCRNSCPHFNDGKGSKPCISCVRFSDKAIFKNSELPRRGVLAHAINLDKADIENLALTHPNRQLREVFEKLPLIDPRLATILLQRTLLRMKLREVAEYHHISQTRVRQLEQEALDEVRKREG
jgi:DNA-directed RNA polymerase specialized sigma24 family protein